MIMSMFQLSYLIVLQPLNKPKENQLEIFTESCILLFTYNMLTFTDFVDDAEVKLKCGFFGISIFFINIFANLVTMVHQERLFKRKGQVK
jgi:hypothetical protein